MSSDNFKAAFFVGLAGADACIQVEGALLRAWDIEQFLGDVFRWFTLWWTNSLQLKMAIEIVDFPINSMVIFHSYVKLPEGRYMVEYLYDAVSSWSIWWAIANIGMI